MKNLAEMTVASHADAWMTGAQNIDASEKMTASSGRVTRADSSLRTNMASSSYSNSGFRTVLCESLARISRRWACIAARGSFARGRLWGAAMSSAPCIVSLVVPGRHVQPRFLHACGVDRSSHRALQGQSRPKLLNSRLSMGCDCALWAVPEPAGQARNDRAAGPAGRSLHGQHASSTTLAPNSPLGAPKHENSADARRPQSAAGAHLPGREGHRGALRGNRPHEGRAEDGRVHQAQPLPARARAGAG